MTDEEFSALVNNHAQHVKRHEHDEANEAKRLVMAAYRAAQKDADRYRWLRDDRAYAPEEAMVRGGVELDELCDEGIAEEKRHQRDVARRIIRGD